MKKVLTFFLLLLLSGALWAQDYQIQLDPSVPEEAAELLTQRFTQMLSAGGAPSLTLAVSAQVTSRMETSGSLSQVALTVDLTASAGEQQEIFTLKGVGESEADAWLRAAKQLIPTSKAARAFVERLKE